MRTSRRLAVLRQQQAELVAAEPRDRVGRSQHVLQPPRELLEQRVADVVAQRVVDLLEAVDVHHHHRDPAAFAARRQDGLPDPVVEERPVREPGEPVVQRLVLVQL